jgi:RES domain-containing protein
MVPPKRRSPGLPPLPPVDFESRALPSVAWEPGKVLFRIHRADHDPLWFGKSGDNRWDAPGGEYGVLYTGTDLIAAFAETFLRNLGAPPLISRRLLADRQISQMVPRGPLSVVDLTGPGLARIGATAAVIHGEYSRTQAWSLAMWSHPEAPDGLLYQARHDPSVHCLALFDRRHVSLEVRTTEPIDADIGRLGALLDRYDIGLSP